jgi:uncharacterized membrane protein
MILLNNHRYALITGIVLAVILAFLMGGTHFYELGLARWFHIVSGVFWIGLLYYFNVAQTPALADAAADKGGPGGAGVTKYVAPRALFWFRWAALATWIGGAWLLMKQGTFVNAFTLGAGSQVIGVGAWLGTIMRARKTAGLASRVNFVLSIPMLMCMAGQSHGLPFMK